MWSKKLIISCCALACLACLLFIAGICPLPPDRVLKVEQAPDGQRIAVYSWRPAGLVGMITKNNPWVFLTIRDRASNRVLARHAMWADMPEEAEVRLAGQKPWP